jgi:hypothetical protein
MEHIAARRRHGGSTARRAAALLLLVAGAASGSAVRAQEPAVPTPREVLGLEIGADSVLADWSQIGEYLTALAAASPRVRLDTVGRTTLGRPMLLVTLTSPENQGRLDRIREGQALLADPRRLDPETEDSLVRTQPAVVFINNNIHSTEIGSSLFSLLLAHRLATDPDYQRFLQDVVVLLSPSANPDGLDTVVAWYRAYKGTPFEGGPLPWLYHPYVGHDNNRDWYMLTQVESRVLARVLYREWFPEVVWDVHQMGNSGARLFLPPFSDPVNPNIDPLVLEATNLVGLAMATALYDAGKTGVIHQSRFDLWWHGGFRTVPARHNMIGILSEAASARLASPIDQVPAELRQDPAGVNYPARWPGGRWGIGDIIAYELLAADGLLRLVAGERETFVRRFVTVGRRAVAAGAAGKPYAYVIAPAQRDPGAVAAFIDLLIGAGVEVRSATQPFTAAGRAFPAGTPIIPLAQPFRAHVKDLVEIQRYPDRREYPGGPPIPPYDATGWTLPLQMGIEVVVVDDAVDPPSVALERAAVAPGTVHGSGTQWLLANRSAAESRLIAQALQLGSRVWTTTQPVSVAGAALPAGSVVIEQRGAPDRLAELVRAHVAHHGFDAWATTGLNVPRDALSRLPRIGLYRPWVASMDEGWTRWVLEQHGIPFVTVTDSTIRAGRLDRELDVLVLPSVDAAEIEHGHPPERAPAPYVGGLGEDGTRNLTAFVRAGGTLVAIDASSEFAIAQLGLPVHNSVRSSGREVDPETFYAPGSVFEISLEPGTPLTSGMDERAFVYFERSAAFEVSGTAQTVGRYVAQPLRSGYALHPERLAGRAAVVRVPVEKGQAVLFGFPPQHRAQTHGTFKLLFNALLLSRLD